MTPRYLIKNILTLVGIGLVLWLITQNISWEEHGTWFLLGLILTFAGADPEDMSLVAAFIGGVTLICAVFWASTAFGGMSPSGGLGFLLLGGLLHLLGQPDVVDVVKCGDCFWHGPVTRLRLGRCPCCGGNALRREGKAICY